MARSLLSLIGRHVASRREDVMQMRKLLSVVALTAELAISSAANAAVIPVSSALRLTAGAASSFGSGWSPITDVESQAATLHPLSVAVQDFSASFDDTVSVKGSATASWSGADRGEVRFEGVGWETAHVRAGGAALVYYGLAYTFNVDTDSILTLRWEISADASTTSDEFGLNGFRFWGPLNTPMPDTEPLPLNSTGTLSRSLTGGDTYTLHIYSDANIGGVLGTRAAFMDGTIYWQVSHIPEPGTLGLLGAGLAGVGFSRRRPV